VDVGIGYLAGPAKLHLVGRRGQRINSRPLGTSLVNTLFVLDDPASAASARHEPHHRG
jgi:excinuclease UvrABC ATPase subunit